MRAVDIITKKRNREELSAAEIEGFIRNYVAGDFADYQVAAFLMAVFLNGMTFQETAALTRAMMYSGEVYDLSDLGVGLPVDKHSTGGVGDKVSLPLAPLAAACGVPVPMVSGRGLGHTGGTLDKLESIPGFSVHMDSNGYREQLKRLGLVMVGQSDNFVPADKRLYALRDVTGTVESIPLICASIMSKKAASGARALVMDVKCGTGAFMSDLKQAQDLATGLRGVGHALGIPVVTLITNMYQPLGRMVGNALEVRESLDCLEGGGPADLREITLELAAEMLSLHKHGMPVDEARARATEVLDSGYAMEKFLEMVKAQGGNPAIAEQRGLLEITGELEEFRASRDGVLTWMNCREIGIAACELGAGRLRTTDSVDHGVGLEMLARLGDRVQAGQPLVRIYHRNGKGLDSCRNRLSSSITIADAGESVQDDTLIFQRMDQLSPG